MNRYQRDTTTRPRLADARALRRLGLAVALLVALAAALAAGANGRPLGSIEPKSGATYTVGTVIKGVCDFGQPGQDFWTYTTLVSKNGYGKWIPPKVGDTPWPTYRVSEGCTEPLDTPGEYRVYLVKQDNRDAAQGGTGQVLLSVSLAAQFTVVAASPCSGDDTEIVSVSTPNGGKSGLEGLKGTHFSPGQTYTARADVELELGDRSVVRVTKGSSFSFGSCSLWPKEHENWKIKFGLFLGKIWSKISARGEVDVATPGATLGIRGAIFWVTYNKATKTTKLRIKEGAGWIRRRSGGPTLRVKGGQTAVQVGKRTPRLARG
ncbi:MAG: hypothetical protein ABSC51_12025 [Gaiellaceae bacterium]